MPNPKNHFYLNTHTLKSYQSLLPLPILLPCVALPCLALNIRLIRSNIFVHIDYWEMEKRMRSLPSDELREPLEGDDLLTMHGGFTKTKMGRLRKGSSNIWTIFTKNGDHIRCKCNYCGKYYGCTTKNGTKSLWNHVNFQCTKYMSAMAAEDKNQKVTTHASNFSTTFDNDSKPVTSNLVAVGFDKELCREACTKMIIVDELSFSFVEKDGFREFCSALCPRFTPPSRRTLTRDIYQFYLSEKSKLKKYFIERSPRVCLTTDTWISIQNINYMVITSHFIDCEWKLHKRILSFGMIPDHKGETIGKLVESCLLD
ncbi:hypothetical protein ACOSQ2_021073 [Xanthoceras sorbifolium]